METLPFLHGTVGSLRVRLMFRLSLHPPVRPPWRWHTVRAPEMATELNWVIARLCFLNVVQQALPFNHSFCLSIALYMPGTELGNRDSMGSQTVRAPDLTELVFLAGEIDFDI